MIQQGRTFSFLSKFVHINHRHGRSPTNHIALVNSNLLIGQYLNWRLDAEWSTVTNCVANVETE